MGCVLGLAGTAGPRSALLLEPWKGAGREGIWGRRGRRTGEKGTARPAGSREPTREAREPPGSRRGSAASVLRGPGWPPGGAAGSRSPPVPPPPPGRRGRALPAAAAAAAAWAAPCPRWILRRRRRELDADGARAGPWGSSASRTRSALLPSPLPPSGAGRRRHASPGMCGLGRARARSSRGARPAPRRAPLRRVGALGGPATVGTPRECPAASTPARSPLCAAPLRPGGPRPPRGPAPPAP